MSSGPLIFAAALIGITIVVGEIVLLSVLTDDPLAFEMGPMLLQAALVAIPFLVLAIVGVRRLLPWVFGLALTLSVWGYVIYSVVSYSRNPDVSGVDFGLALIVMPSPFIISAIALSINALQEWISSGS